MMPGWLQLLLWVCLFLAAIGLAVAFLDPFTNGCIALLDRIQEWSMKNHEEALKAFKKGWDA